MKELANERNKSLLLNCRVQQFLSKRIKMIMITLMMTIVTSASAMTYSQAKDQALFLADKMAYELNLTDEQYEAAYEINLDYLMAVNDYNDLYGTYWTRRNLELQSILATWQYNAYIAADYFYRPVYWSDNRWYWRIYSRYAADRYYNSRPTVYVTYRGGNNRNYYTSRTWTKPTHRVVRTTSIRNVRQTNTTGNRTFGNLNTNNVNRTTNVNINNVNMNNRNVNRTPSYRNNSRPVAQAKPSTTNRSFGTRQTTTTRSKTSTGRFGNR